MEKGSGIDHSKTVTRQVSVMENSGTTITLEQAAALELLGAAKEVRECITVHGQTHFIPSWTLARFDAALKAMDSSYEPPVDD